METLTSSSIKRSINAPTGASIKRSVNVPRTFQFETEIEKAYRYRQAYQHLKYLTFQQNGIWI